MRRSARSEVASRRRGGRSRPATTTSTSGASCARTAASRRPTSDAARPPSARASPMRSAPRRRRVIGRRERGGGSGPEGGDWPGGPVAGRQLGSSGIGRVSGLQVGSKRDGGKGSIAGAASALGSSMTRQAPRELGAEDRRPPWSRAIRAAMVRPRPRGAPPRRRAISRLTGSGRPGPASLTSMRTRPATTRPRTRTGEPPCSSALATRLPHAWARRSGSARTSARPRSGSTESEDPNAAASGAHASAPSSSSAPTSTSWDAATRAVPAAGGHEIVERQRRPPQLEVDRGGVVDPVQPQPRRAQRPAQLVARVGDEL